MKIICSFCLLIVLGSGVLAQSLYFPPLTGTQWDTLSPAGLGWNAARTDSLYNFLERKNSKAFIVLKDGRIVLEKYFGTFVRDSLWYWASAGKTLTSFLVGLAKQEGFLSLQDTTSKYLGSGWTSEPPAKEALITIRHQLTMSSGLKDNVADPYCTDAQCLVYQADAGTRWAYHNAPYTLLDSVITRATGISFQQFYATRVRQKTAINGVWIRNGYNNVFYSTARSMSRFGLLLLAKGSWGTDTLMRDTAYYRAMVNTSQNINNSYGYLFWLNGKQSYMLPQSQFVFNGWLCPNAPQDMYAALGKNGQVINVVPSLNLVFVRMGDKPDSSFEVPNKFNDDIWVYLNKVINRTVSVDEKSSAPEKESFTCSAYPNPSDSRVNLVLNLPDAGLVSVQIISLTGEVVFTITPENKARGKNIITVPVAGLVSGVYLYHIVYHGKDADNKSLTGKFTILHGADKVR